MGRDLRRPVEAGNMPYSAVTHPSPCSFRQGGTSGSMLAVQIILVPPTSIRQLPSAVPTKPGVIVTGLSCPARLPSVRRYFLSAMHKVYKPNRANAIFHKRTQLPKRLAPFFVDISSFFCSGQLSRPGKLPCNPGTYLPCLPWPQQISAGHDLRTLSRVLSQACIAARIRDSPSSSPSIASIAPATICDTWTG